jgi:hypothetical protein
MKHNETHCKIKYKNVILTSINHIIMYTNVLQYISLNYVFEPNSHMH